MEALDRTLDDDELELEPASESSSQAPTPAEPRRRGRKKKKSHAGVALCTLHGRKYHPQPGATVLDAGARAETEHGGEADLVIVAVDPGQGPEAEAAIRKALG